MLLAFTGMYYCLKELTKNCYISLFTALIFVLLPFFSIYGLSIMGQPLLLYTMICLAKQKNKVRTFILIAIFVGFSSLSLVGYVDILLITLYCLVHFIRRKKHTFNPWIYIGMITLIALYLIFNINLILSLLVPSSFISQRTVYKLIPENVRQDFTNMWKLGHYHAPSLHAIIQRYSLVGLLLFTLYYRRLKLESKKLYYFFITLLASAAAIAAFYAFWHCRYAILIRNQLGGIFVYFQLDRFYWLNPAIWFLIFGFILYFVTIILKDMESSKFFNAMLNLKKFHISIGPRLKKIFFKTVCLILCTYLIGTVGLHVYTQSSITNNVSNVRNKTDKIVNNYVSWKRFFAEDVFTQIKDYIGKDQSSYKVASLALYSSIPLYNGFYCIDGYSNNYSLEYKTEFRKIIEKELNKNKTIQSYYDDWGNRCYLFTAQLGTAYVFEKDNSTKLTDLELNTNQLKEMGCDYIFSGVEIASAKQKGLAFVKSFESKDSMWRIYVYEVKSVGITN